MYRLLIVDERNTAEMLCGLVDWAGLGFDTVDWAGSYAGAVNKALDLHPHAALVAADLEGHQGIALVEHLRSVGLKTVFALTMTPKDLPDIRRAMRAGVRDVLPKPVSGEDLAEFAQWVVVQVLRGVLPETREADPDKDPVLQMEYAALSKITNKILLLVRSEYRQSLSLTAIAEEFNMSGKYIGRIFLKDTGIRFSQYLMAYRMLEARKLIEGTNEKISVIASMVGYSQVNNFYTHFRTYFGVSPSSMRNFDTVKGDQT